MAAKNDTVETVETETPSNVVDIAKVRKPRQEVQTSTNDDFEFFTDEELSATFKNVGGRRGRAKDMRLHGHMSAFIDKANVKAMKKAELPTAWVAFRYSGTDSAKQKAGQVRASLLKEMETYKNDPSDYPTVPSGYVWEISAKPSPEGSVLAYRIVDKLPKDHYGIVTSDKIVKRTRKAKKNAETPAVENAESTTETVVETAK